jgi:Putative metallopeptidase
MTRVDRYRGALLCTAILWLSTAAIAEEPAAPKISTKPGQIQIAYVSPPNPAHEEIYELMKERRVLERFRDYLSAVRLPGPLLLKFDGCDGESNAWYEPDDHAVTVCYEYIDEVLRNAPQETTAAGVTRDDAIAGPGVEVFLHEIGHALFDMLKVPILGREEDAADQIAAYALLQLGPDEARRTVVGVAYMYGHEAQGQTPQMKHFADVHGLPAQRFYNLLCMAYGADPTLFADLVEKKYLPESRADGCADEYKQVSYAVHQLISPHLDPKLIKKVKSKKWLRSPAPSERKSGAAQ